MEIHSLAVLRLRGRIIWCTGVSAYPRRLDCFDGTTRALHIGSALARSLEHISGSISFHGGQSASNNGCNSGGLAYRLIAQTKICLALMEA
jgi:hypothetical protein